MVPAQDRLVLTVMIDAVNQADPDLGVVISHEDNIKEFFTVGVELSQLSVDSFKSLQVQRKREE